MPTSVCVYWCMCTTPVLIVYRLGKVGGQAQSKVTPEQLSTLKLHLSSSIFTWGSIRVHFLIIMYPPVSIVQVWNIFFCTRDLVLALGSVVVNAVNQLGMP